MHQVLQLDFGVPFEDLVAKRLDVLFHGS
jgi:hypothetical protein